MASYNRIREENKSVFEKQIKKENTEILENKNNSDKKLRASRSQSSLISLKVMDDEKGIPLTPTTVGTNANQQEEKQLYFKKKPASRKYS